MATTKRCKSGKRQFHSEKQAKRAITAARQSVEHGHQRAGYIPVRAYPCAVCHRWHLTSEADQHPYSERTRRLVLECLSMNGGESPTGFVAGWNQPGYLPENSPMAFDAWEEARDYILAELKIAYDAELEAHDGERFYTAGRMEQTYLALESLDGVEEWSSGDALAGYVYWIMPEST